MKKQYNEACPIVWIVIQYIMGVSSQGIISQLPKGVASNLWCDIISHFKIVVQPMQKQRKIALQVRDFKEQ